MTSPITPNNPIGNSIIQIIKEEITKADGWNKFILWAIVANIPIPLFFIPYATQALTIILLAFYLKHYPRSEQPANVFIGKTAFGIPTPVFAVIVITMLIQLSWVPFMTQLVTIAALGLLFSLSRSNN